ncbi:phosphoglycolate phosphatase [Candidatus Igneacidithiobacillus taiwanensis]|uniref:phosphoglycolate phosphatase n=1 Tax=Candidatus Igneacidithiobacillus taiwanensis TaxID=1945924 RepID=UPI0028A1B752|nr:phosphoglycolate phosphatase [Candidatus Igneacidithiobacillus taiwanensis]
MSFSPRFLLLDLDGTLIDTAPDLAASANHVLESLGRPAAPMPVIRGFIGNGVRELMRRALAIEAEPSEAELEAAMPAFSRYYGEHLWAHSRPYDGVPETLAALHGKLPLVCITNKAAQFTEPLLEHFGLRRYFDLVLSGDSLPRKKPDPLPLTHAASHFGHAPEAGLLVGDSINDTQAAKAAGMPVVCVSYGYRGDMPLTDLAADAIIDTMPELLAVLRHGEGHS